MRHDIDYNFIKSIDKFANPLGDAMRDYDPIVNAAHNKIFVMIGEASHGTSEFYHARADITKRLIEELGFDAVVAEADWPDAYRINRYVSLMSDESAERALSDFERFPTWMWRNREVLEFIKWLRAYNHEFRSGRHRPAGFYGMDLYSMGTSIDAVLSYLDNVDPFAAKRARIRYGCLDYFTHNPQSYGYASAFSLAESCEKDIVAQLTELRRNAFEYMKRDGLAAEDEYFCAEQNARLIKNAEEYYRSMFRERRNSWNLRDRHMFGTLESLVDHLGKRLDRDPRIVVWAHNSHIGNAGATEMHKRGEINIGQLVRSHYSQKSLLIGLTTCTGTVMAADDWDEPYRVMKINKPLPGSYEDIFYHSHHKSFLLDLRADNDAVDNLMIPRLQRAIGVVYRPETERHSHYVESCLPEQFDFIIHYDESHAVEALDSALHLHRGDMDETYPSGL